MITFTPIDCWTVPYIEKAALKGYIVGDAAAPFIVARNGIFWHGYDLDTKILLNSRTYRTRAEAIKGTVAKIEHEGVERLRAARTRAHATIKEHGIIKLTV